LINKFNDSRYYPENLNYIKQEIQNNNLKIKESIKKRKKIIALIIVIFFILIAFKQFILFFSELISVVSNFISIYLNLSEYI